jgi:hypothetical protein
VVFLAHFHIKKSVREASKVLNNLEVTRRSVDTGKNMNLEGSLDFEPCFYF